MNQITLPEVIRILESKGVRYVSMINFLKLNNVERLDEKDGVIVARFSSDDKSEWAIVAADTPEEIRSIRDRLAEETRFAATEHWILSVIAKEREVLWEEQCYTYHLPDDVELPEVVLPDMPLEYAELVNEHWTYNDDWSLPYIQTCLKSNPSSAKFVDGKPVAWAVVQDDGAMGCMFVLPDYRRNGYAQEVAYDLIRKQRERGQVPFVHIVTTNTPSIKLTEGMGFKRLKEIAWFEVR